MSVNGNQYFTSIENAAGQLNFLSAASGSLNLDNLNLGVGTLGTGGRTLYTAVGYAPTTFATTVSTGVVNLNVSANLGQASSATDTNLLLLPGGAQIVAVNANNNGTTIVGGTSFDIGLNASLATGDASIMATVTLATLNSARGGNVVDSTGGLTAGTNFGGTGNAASTVAVTEGDVVAVTVNTTPNTAGDLKVTIQYLL
jgi:hypothetical protein